MEKDIEKTLLLELREDIRDIKKDVNDIKVLDAVQNEQLAYHIKRTDLLQQEVKEQRNFKWYFAGLSTLVAGIIAIVLRYS